MKTEAMAALIGKKVKIKVSFEGKDLAANSLTFPVKITDCKPGFGHTFIEVTPIGGTGKVWTNYDRVVS